MYAWNVRILTNYPNLTYTMHCGKQQVNRTPNQPTKCVSELALNTRDVTIVHNTHSLRKLVHTYGSNAKLPHSINSHKRYRPTDVHCINHKTSRTVCTKASTGLEQGWVEVVYTTLSRVTNNTNQPVSSRRTEHNVTRTAARWASAKVERQFQNCSSELHHFRQEQLHSLLTSRDNYTPAAGWSSQQCHERHSQYKLTHTTTHRLQYHGR